jgi:hypothetical protein
MNKAIIVGVMLLLPGSLLAQKINESEQLIQYDPLFWKDQLKLDNDQCIKIREINGEYYKSLFIAYKEEKDDRKALRKLADKSLMQRNQEIWDTFDSRQRKRWKRIWQVSIARTTQNES